MSKMIDGKDLKPGDKIGYPSASFRVLVVRKLPAHSVLPEENNVMLKSPHIVWVSKEGKFGAHVENYTFDLVERLHDNLQTTPEKVSYKDLKPGDIFSGGPDIVNGYAIAIKNILPGEDSSIAENHNKKEGLLFRNPQFNLYYVTDLIHLYRFKSSFSNAVSTIQTDVFDASAWGSICDLCSAPSYKGFVGKPQCSNPKCVLHTN